MTEKLFILSKLQNIGQCVVPIGGRVSILIKVNTQAFYQAFHTIFQYHSFKGYIEGYGS